MAKLVEDLRELVKESHEEKIQYEAAERILDLYLINALKETAKAGNKSFTYYIDVQNKFCTGALIQLLCREGLAVSHNKHDDNTESIYINWLEL
jgi:hypothetical protein